jgi:hypothetical protein
MIYYLQFLPLLSNLEFSLVFNLLKIDYVAFFDFFKKFFGLILKVLFN